MMNEHNIEYIIKKANLCANDINYGKKMTDKLYSFITEKEPKDMYYINRMNKGELHRNLRLYDLSSVIYQNNMACFFIINTVRGQYIYLYRRNIPLPEYDLDNGYKRIYVNGNHFLVKDNKILNIFTRNFTSQYNVEESFISNDFIVMPEEMQNELINMMKTNTVLLALKEIN